MKSAAATAAMSDHPSDRPKELHLTIQGGMLEALGINMYTSIGKCLVEFAANSYDSESSYAKIAIPFDRIEEARRQIREAAKVEVKKGKRDKFTVLLAPLPDDIEITIEDDGHGMTAQELQDKFLPLNRNRRAVDASTDEPTNVKSEGGRRHVMGRKGLGKLAGFGAAEQITVWTKREGETYATSFTMDYNVIKAAAKLYEVPFIPTYTDDLPAELHGTKITLRKLRCDALKSKSDVIVNTLAENFFGIDESDFCIWMGEKPVREEPVDYEFYFPEDRDDSGFATAKIEIEDIDALEIRYVAKFRARPNDEGATAQPTDKRRGSLPAGKRGARIYCNKRLAVGPSLLDLHSGVHNFRAQDYLECIVHADELDRHSIDFVNTNRSDLRRDNEVVDKVIETVTEIMKKALAANYNFRDAKAEQRIEQDEFAKPFIQMLEVLPKRTRSSARQMLKTMAREEGLHSERFKQFAPLLMQSMNAGEVLVKLAELGNDPKTLVEIARSLHELSKIEQQDILKLYRARRAGISALQTLINRGEASWQKSPHFENELHALVRENPWLIRPEYARYLTSDKPMGHVAKMLTQELKIDEYAPDTVADSQKRPDLVFALVDQEAPSSVILVEFKSPTIPLDNEHYGQLEDYVTQVRGILGAEYQQKIMIRGHLIGAMPAHDTKVVGQLTLLNKSKKPDSEIEVLGLHEMLSRTWKVHIDAIKALEEFENSEAEAPENVPESDKKAADGPGDSAT